MIRQAVRILTGGNHHPILCQCEDLSSGQIKLWVVKPQRIESLGNRRGALDVLAELAAAEACTWVGVNTPSIGLTRFPDDVNNDLFCDVPDEQRKEVAEVFRLNRGLIAFCSRYLLQAVDIVPETLRHRTAAPILAASTALFALDVYMRHDDREEENPNSVWWRDSIVAIDNGSSFAGLDKPGMTGKALAAHTVLHSRRFHKHVLHDSLVRQAQNLNWESVVNNLMNVKDEEIDGTASAWPDELDKDALTSRSGLKKNLVEFLRERRGVARQVIEAAAKLCRRAA